VISKNAETNCADWLPMNFKDDVRIRKRVLAEEFKAINAMKWLNYFVGGTGFQPVVPGILPGTWDVLYARGLSNVQTLSLRAKSGRMPDLTGWKPVPPGFEDTF